MATLIPYASLLAAPWKNGGGSTTEICIAPAGAGFDNFDWRISLATIAHSGPFSSFAGIDRTLTLVAGAGVMLQIEHARNVALCAATPIIEFAGEAAVHATVTEGVTTDFNVMTRRARCHHQLERRNIAGASTLARRSATTLLFVAEGERVDVGAFTLGHFDALILDADDRTDWTLTAPGAALLFIVDIIECE